MRTLAAPDVTAEISRWLGYLGAERRMSPKTLEAYRRDVGQFLDFLAGHLGGAPTLRQLAKLSPADVRAFMAARRGDGLSSRSLMRVLAGARSFARFLERNGKGKVGALSAVRAPKVGKTLPKPLAIAAAKRIADTGLRAGEAREPWIIARDQVFGLKRERFRDAQARAVEQAQHRGVAGDDPRLACFAATQIGIGDVLGRGDCQRLRQGFADFGRAHGG